MTAEQLIQIIASALLFLGVWALFRRILVPFIKNVEERQERTFGDEHSAVEKRQKVKVLDAEIEELLRRARLEGAESRDAKVAAAKKEAQQMLESAEAWAAEELKKAEDEVVRVKTRALSEVPSEVEKLSRLVVERALSSGGSNVMH